MATAKKNGIQPDEFCDDGKTRKLNRTRPFGIVYSAQLDGQEGHFEECKFYQDNVGFRGDGTPVGYIPAAERGEPVVVPPVEEVMEDNERLRLQVNAQQGQIADLLKRLEALETSKAPPPAKAESRDAGRRAS